MRHKGSPIAGDLVALKGRVTMHPVFRAEKKGDVRASTTIYADGHVRCIFDRRIRDIDKTMTYVKVAKSIPVRNDGKIAVYFGRDGDGVLIAFAELPNAAMEAVSPSLDNGSCILQSKGIAYGYVAFRSDVGGTELGVVSDLTGDYSMLYAHLNYTFLESLDRHDEYKPVKVYGDDGKPVDLYETKKRLKADLLSAASLPAEVAQ